MRKIGFLATGLVFVLSNVLIAGTYSGGSGTLANPYKIATAADMNAIGADRNDWSKCFILMNDVDMSGLTYNVIGDAATPFTGDFNGNGHIISNLTAFKSSYAGVFGYIAGSGSITNLGAVNVNISGGYDVGGLIGYKKDSISVSGCFVTGTVAATGNRVGGFIGSNSNGYISNCYAICAVSFSQQGGGFAGVNGLNTTPNATITRCYSAGAVSGYWDIGGFVGVVTGNVMKITDCFWDAQASGQSGGALGVGISTAKMKSASTFQMAGWSGNGWVIEDGADYPRLAWQGTSGTAIPAAVSPFAGSGTADSPYLISTKEEFAALGYCSALFSKYFVLTNDIDMAGADCIPVGLLKPFTGSFDGYYNYSNMHKIKNVTINMPNTYYAGVFGYISNGRIENIGVVNAAVTGKLFVGALAGLNRDAYIVSCYSTGSVSGYMYTGGLVGMNQYSIEYSYSAVAVDGNYYSGGLIGYHSGAVYNSYATGSVNSGSTAGGLAGWNNSGYMSNCYSTGAVTEGSYPGNGFLANNTGGTTENCFWDTQASGCQYSAAGAGKTTAEMQTQSTFTDAGWDFMGEEANGYYDYWFIPSGGGYPKLFWQYQHAPELPPIFSGLVDLQDYAVFAANWLDSDCGTCNGADLTGDGNVGPADLIILAANWLGIVGAE